VETTRRFLCEWLSFAHRYVPVGLLERWEDVQQSPAIIPGATGPYQGFQRMNDRPPYFMGRDELETLMGSTDSRDWVKLTELVLGTAPESFKFIPKHRSNSYEVPLE
jgi:tRNA-dihydrouridine synthase 3